MEALTASSGGAAACYHRGCGITGDSTTGCCCHTPVELMQCIESMESTLQALSEAKANDLLFWASRYHLFVHWSANRAHPWDSLPKSEAACAILEIGKLRNSDGEVRPALIHRAHHCIYGR